MNAIPCQQLKGIHKSSKKKRDEVYVDPLSVEHCLTCTLPVEQCRGAPSVRSGKLNRRAICPYEWAIAERKRKPRTVTLPGLDGVMRDWECAIELGRQAPERVMNDEY